MTNPYLLKYSYNVGTGPTGLADYHSGEEWVETLAEIEQWIAVKERAVRNLKVEIRYQQRANDAKTARRASKAFTE